MLEHTALSKAEETDEALLMGLRLAEGIDLDDLAAIGGLSPDQHAIDELVASALIERQGASHASGDARRPVRAQRRSFCACPRR